MQCCLAAWLNLAARGGKMVTVLLSSTLCPNVDFVDLNGATTDAEHDRRFPGGKFLG